MKVYPPIILLGLFISLHVQAQWTQCNGPYGGGGLSLIAENPITKTIFAGQEFGVLYRLKANSNKWENLQSKLGSKEVVSLASIGNVVCVTTASSGLYTGLYVTYDDGDTWFTIASTTSGNIRFVFANDSTLIATGDQIFYTRDGINFTNIPKPLPPDFVAFITIKGSRLFAWCSSNSNENTLVIEYSDNWGQRWINANMDSVPGFIYPNYPITPFIAYNDSLYFFPGYSRELVSGDNGASWALRQNISQPFNGYPFYQLTKTTNGILDAGPDGLSYYDTAWNPMNENGLYLAGIQFICRSQNNLFVYLDGDSVLKSFDNGESWQTALQLPQGVPIVSMTNNGNTINIYSETGNRYYSEDGSTVEMDSINTQLNFGGFTDLQYTKNNTYGLLDIGFAFCSSNDGGKTWDTIKWADDYDNGIYRCYFGDFAVDGSNIILSLLHYVQYPYTTPQSYSSILYSHDGGITFSESSSYPVHNGPTGSESAYIYHTSLLGNKALAIGPLLYKSDDAGITWYQDSLVNDSLIAMYVIAPNFVVLGGSNGEILLSSDTGNSFTYITGNFPDVANQFYFLGTQLYAVTSNSGIWKTDGSKLDIPNNYYLAQLANGTSQAAIFPNPSRNSITVDLAADLDLSNVYYKIYNTLGQLIANGSTQVKGNIFSLSTAALEKGVYYLQLQSINNNKGIKFVID